MPGLPHIRLPSGGLPDSRFSTPFRAHCLACHLPGPPVNNVFTRRLLDCMATGIEPAPPVSRATLAAVYQSADRPTPSDPGCYPGTAPYTSPCTRVSASRPGIRYGGAILRTVRRLTLSRQSPDGLLLSTLSGCRSIVSPLNLGLWHRRDLNPHLPRWCLGGYPGCTACTTTPGAAEW